MKELGFRRWSVVMVSVLGVMVLTAIGKPIGIDGAAALVGIVAGYCGFDASIKKTAKATSGGGGLHSGQGGQS